MNLKFNTPLDLFVLFIIIIKIIFVLSAAAHVIVSHKGTNIVRDDKLEYIKSRTEFVFIVSMAILLIYNFRPGHDVLLTEETRFLFFLFGMVLIFTADWKIFIKDAPWFKYIMPSTMM
ncbi:MAG: hypothetical protein ACTSRX_08945 [Promethearchaeota archaeon]